MNQNASDLTEGEIRVPVCTHCYGLRKEWTITTNFSENNGNHNPKFISLSNRGPPRNL